MADSKPVPSPALQPGPTRSFFSSSSACRRTRPLAWAASNALAAHASLFLLLPPVRNPLGHGHRGREPAPARNPAEAVGHREFLFLLLRYPRYEGAARVEEFPFPEAALREALLNALAHKDYSGGTATQISVYEDRLLFWNEGHLPDRWTTENLTRKHPSKPFNPDVANALFRAGYIEAWGRGTLKMLAECRAAHLPAPRYSFDAAGFGVEFRRYTAAYLAGRGLRAVLVPLVLKAQNRGALTNAEVRHLAGVSKPTASRYLAELERAGYLQKSGVTGVGTRYVLKDS